MGVGKAESMGQVTIRNGGGQSRIYGASNYQEWGWAKQNLRFHGGISVTCQAFAKYFTYMCYLFDHHKTYDLIPILLITN